VVGNVRRDEDGVAWPRFLFLVSTGDEAVSVEDEDFVFPAVGVGGRLASWFDFEASHGEVFCVVFFCY